MLADQTRVAVTAHFAAFNAHHTQDLIAGCTADARWETGSDLFEGTAALQTLFSEGLWQLDPHLEVLRLVVEDGRAAAQLRETITVGADRRGFAIAVFLELSDGLIRAAKVYREGSADIATA